MTKTRLFVVDDNPLFCDGLKTWINSQPDLLCCGEARSLAAARRTLLMAKPDVLLLDLRLGDGDGLDYASELREVAPGLRILVLSQHEEGPFAARALRAGAHGYGMKSEAAETVHLAIQTVLRGEVFLSRRAMADVMPKAVLNSTPASPEMARLSQRELQVFQSLGAQHGVQETAQILRISVKTVETYCEHLKDKLALPTTEALKLAASCWVRTGQLPDSSPPQARPQPVPIRKPATNEH